MGPARFAGRIARAGELGRGGGGKHRHAKIAEADRALLHREGQSRTDQGILQGPAGHVGYFRRRAFAGAGTQPGESPLAQGARSHPIDSRYFRAARAQPRRTIADRAGAIAISAPAPDADVEPLVASDRRNRHARPRRNATRSGSPAGAGADRAARTGAGRSAQSALGATAGP